MCDAAAILKLILIMLSLGPTFRIRALTVALDNSEQVGEKRGLPSILSLFRKEFNKFNYTRAQILDSIHHMTLKLLGNLISGVKT